jgi:D-proline reductase (dithiol) PrdB
MEQAKEGTPGRNVEVMDVTAFREAYGPWLEETRPLLEAADWKGAFATFPFPRPAEAPWSPLEKPLAECRVALLSTAGVYLRDSQQPFDAENIEGDWSFREVPCSAKPADLSIAHTHYDHANAEADLNTVLPLDRLRELQAEGFIGELLSPFFSISGYCTRPDLVAEETAPRVVERMKALGADALLNVAV